MKERPILFSGPMVQALLRDPSDPLCKREARRVVKGNDDVSWCGWPCDHDDASLRRLLLLPAPHPGRRCARPADSEHHFHDRNGFHWWNETCPYGVPGRDRLWVREAWCRGVDRVPGDGRPTHPTDGWSCLYRATEPDACNAEHPSRFAPWRPSIHMPRWASRLTLAVESVRVERLHDIDDAGARREGVADREAYRALWESINGAESWDANPWVWVVGFRRVTP